MSKASSHLDNLLLANSVQKSLVSVREISEGGNVPNLVVENRVGNITLLIPAGSKTTIPVSCVELGRWAYNSDEFSGTDHVQFARGSVEKIESVQRSMRATGDRHSVQSLVWRSISEKAEVVDARSPTAAMGSIFEHHTDELADYVKAVPLCDNQVSGLFVVANELFGLDVFDQPATFEAIWPKLVRSYARRCA